MLRSPPAPLAPTAPFVLVPLVLVPLVLVALAAGCPEPEPDPAPDGGGSIVARDAGLFPEVDAGPPADAGSAALCPTDDASEDNDTRATATPLTGEVVAIACGGDDDFYVATARADCLVTASLSFNESTGDVDLQLYDPDGVLIDADTGVGSEAVVATTASAAGDYSVRVTSDPAVAAAYRLRLSVSCEADLMCPADDGFEDDDTPIDATPLASGETALGILCGDDDDHFSIAAPVGCAVSAALSYTHVAGKDVDMRVVLADESEAQRSLSANGTEATYTLVEAGSSPVLRVEGFGASFTDNTYRLTLSRVCAADLDCSVPDPAEPNDVDTEAFRIFPGAGALGQLCPAEEDWFRFTATAGCTYDLLLDFAHSTGNLSLQVLKVDDTVVGTGVSTDDDESVQVIADANGTLRARVFAFSAQTSNTFRLQLSESCPAP